MWTRTAFVDDMQAAKDFATGDIVRRMGYREMLPGPFAGRVIYSNPYTGKVHVQWPWGAEEEPATELIRDLSGEVAANLAVDQIYSTWEQAKLTDEDVARGVENRWFEGLLDKSRKWRKKLAASVPERSALLVPKIVSRYERRTRPLWRAACRAWYDGLDEMQAFRRLLSSHSPDFGVDAVRVTVANLYGLASSPDPRFALYWKDHNRRYKVTQREQQLGKLRCPRCGQFRIKPRTYRQGKKILLCHNCGFSISPKDLIWDDAGVSAPEPAPEAT